MDGGCCTCSNLQFKTKHRYSDQFLQLFTIDLFSLIYVGLCVLVCVCVPVSTDQFYLF